MASRNSATAEQSTQFETVYPTMYVWPAAFGNNPSSADWDEVRCSTPRRRIASMKLFAATFYGNWVFFVVGD